MIQQYHWLLLELGSDPSPSSALQVYVKELFKYPILVDSEETDVVKVAAVVDSDVTKKILAYIHKVKKYFE